MSGNPRSGSGHDETDGEEGEGEGDSDDDDDDDATGTSGGRDQGRPTERSRWLYRVAYSIQQSIRRPDYP